MGREMEADAMSLEIFNDIEQGSDEWFAARCGIVTASVVGQLITKGPPDALAVDCPKCQAPATEACISTARKVPTPIKTAHDERASKAAELPPVYSIAANDTSRGLTATLVAERITGRVSQVFPSRDMERGTLDEPYARAAYSEHYAPVDEMGFLVADDLGFRLGYSPDGLVGYDGLIEIKSRTQKKHLQTILADEVPAENMAQIQCGLLVSGREWCDYVSFCSGMPLWIKRVLPEPHWFAAIIDAAKACEESAAYMIGAYSAATVGLPETEYIDHFAELEINF
jgi:hypothetical protein